MRVMAITAVLAAALAPPADATSDVFDAAYEAQSRGDYQAAIRLYSEALASHSLDPANQARAFMNRGSAHGAAGMLERAATDFDAAVVLLPDDAEAVNGRATVRFLLGDLRTAYADFAHAWELKPDDPYIGFWYEITRRRLGEPDHGTFAANAGRYPSGAWPRPIVDVFLGRAEAESLEAFTGDATDERARGIRCEAAFFLGELDLVRDALDTARGWLDKAARWCPVSFIEFVAARSELQTLDRAPQTPDVAGYRYATTADVNVRAGPGTNYPRVATATEGTDLEVAGLEFGWYRVNGFGPQAAYVHGSYVAALELPGAQRSAPAREPQSPASPRVYRATTRVNYRDGPGTSYRRLGQLDAGDTITALGTRHGWLRFQPAGADTAYVHSNFMTED